MFLWILYSVLAGSEFKSILKLKAQFLVSSKFLFVIFDEQFMTIEKSEASLKNNKKFLCEPFIYINRK